MSVDSDADHAPPTTGLDAVDYGQFDHFHIEDDLLVYAFDSEEAWIQSDLYVRLDDRV